MRSVVSVIAAVAILSSSAVQAQDLRDTSAPLQSNGNSKKQEQQTAPEDGLFDDSIDDADVEEETDEESFPLESAQVQTRDDIRVEMHSGGSASEIQDFDKPESKSKETPSVDGEIIAAFPLPFEPDAMDSSNVAQITKEQSSSDVLVTTVIYKANEFGHVKTEQYVQTRLPDGQITLDYSERYETRSQQTAHHDDVIDSDEQVFSAAVTTTPTPPQIVVSVEDDSSEQSADVDSLTDDQEEEEVLTEEEKKGSSLEQIHIFALAHILRRPIIVYGIKYVKSYQGDNIGLARFQGVYLPLLWEPTFCWRTPVALGYTRGHFSALVPMEADLCAHLGARANIDTNDDAPTVYLPLMDYEGKILPVHFLQLSEIGHEESLLHEWLNCCKTESGLLVAKQQLIRPPHLVQQMVEEWIHRYRGLAEMLHSPGAPPPPPPTLSSDSESDDE